MSILVAAALCWSVFGCSTGRLALTARGDLHEVAYFGFDNVKTSLAPGGEYLLCADRPPTARGGVWCEGYPSAEARSRLVLIGWIDPENRRMALAIAGDTSYAYAGSFVLEASGFPTADWRFDKRGLRASSVVYGERLQIEESLAGQDVKRYRGGHATVDLDMWVDEPSFARCFERVEERFRCSESAAVQGVLKRFMKMRAGAVGDGSTEKPQSSREDEVLEIARRYMASTGRGSDKWEFHARHTRDDDWSVYCREGPPMVDSGLWLIVSGDRVVDEFRNGS